MSSRNEHEPPDGGGGRGAESTRGVRGLGVSVAVLLVAIGALIVRALATRSDTPVDRESNGAAPAAGRNTGERGGTVAQIRASRREGNALIDTSLATKLEALRGVPVVVNQWASWCPPCRAEFPFFAELAERYRSKVAFLGLNSRDQRGAAEAFLEEHPVSYPSVFDENAEQARSIGAGTGWPTTVFFDADHNAVLIRQGGYTDAAALEADIREHALGLPRADPE
jgi:cytochrome c biogenesis protein CcmG, thiol:disulfide interchange protein DsbE